MTIKENISALNKAKVDLASHPMSLEVKESVQYVTVYLPQRINGFYLFRVAIETSKLEAYKTALEKAE